MLHKNTLSTALAATLFTLGLTGAAVAAENTTTHAQTGTDSSTASKHVPDIKHDTAGIKTAHMSKARIHKDPKDNEKEEQEESCDNDQEEADEDSHKK